MKRTYQQIRKRERIIKSFISASALIMGFSLIILVLILASNF